MRKIFLISLFITSIVFFLNSNSLFSHFKPSDNNKSITSDYAKFRLIIDTNVNPFLFENALNLYGFGLNGSIMCGARIKMFTIGAEVFDNYYSLTNSNNNNLTSAAWNIIRGSLDFYVEPAKWVELKLGLGGSWYSSTYIFSDIGTVGKNKWGPSFLFNVSFMPVNFFQICLVNYLDLLIGDNTLLPYYFGGIRFNFNPGIKIINFYVEASGMPYLYNANPESSYEIKSGLFLWSAGISIDLSLPYDIKKKVKLINPEIEKLKNAKDGDVIRFNNIIFFPDSDEIKKESNQIMEEIAGVLKDRKDISIEVRGYTNYINKPKEEFELSRKRAGKIKEYLIRKNIEERRLKTFGFGGFYSRNKDINEANRRVEVEIKILSKKELQEIDNLEKILNAKKNDNISLSNIYFDEKTNKLAQDSIIYLDKLAVMLLYKNNINIGIAGYSKKSGNPYTDLILSSNRAKLIRAYLYDKGITQDRIKILATGNIYTSIDAKEKPKIEIKIL